MTGFAPEATHLPLPGTTNLRDLAGCSAGEGLVIGPRRLLRGELLAGADGPDLQGRFDEAAAPQFQALGLRTVIDLRSQREAAAVRSVWGQVTGARELRFPIDEGGDGADTTAIQLLLSGAKAAFTEQDLTDLYLGMLARNAEEFAGAVAALAEPERLPALVHCAAGKDRTGLAIALVLELLATPRDIVLADYELTERLRPDRVSAYAPMLRQHGVGVEAARVLFESPRRAMASTLDHLDRRWGGAAGYLVGAGDLDPDVPGRLRAVMLVDPS